MACPPDLVNYLVIEVSDTPGFQAPTAQVVPARTPSFPVNGTAGQTRYVRSKWRRTTDPLDEGPWSGVVTLEFQTIVTDDTDGLPCCGPGSANPPEIPVIRSVVGWDEFIEVSLLANPQGEGCVVGYGTGFTGPGRVHIYVKNTSTDPSISIVEAALLIGKPFPQIDCHGEKTIAAGFHPGDEFLAESEPIADVSNYAPYLADPPVADIAVPSGQIKYYQVAEENPPDVDPGNPDYECLITRCPEPTDAGYNAQYRCISVFDTARTPAGFDLPGGSDYYVRVDAGICRAFGLYSGALGRTIFPPFMGVSIGIGHFAGFTQVGTVYVRFSTGLALFQPAVDMGPGLGGISLVPTTAAALQLDDFFVFASETPFAADLGGSGGLWQNALLENALPDGVHLVMVSRSTNFLVSNLGGVPLDPAKTEAEWPNYTQGYYFRVGARRFLNLAQSEFLYSATLSEQGFGRLGTADRLDEALGEGAAGGAAGSWGAPVPTSDDLPEAANPGDVRLVVDEGALYAFYDGLWRRAGLGTLQVANEMVFGVSVVVVGSSRGFRPTIPKGILNGVLTGWCLQVDTSGNGDTVIDFHKNGTTLFTNQANRPKLISGQVKSTGSTIDVTAVSSEDDITLDIDSVPGTPPTKLTAILYFRQDVKVV